MRFPRFQKKFEADFQIIKKVAAVELQPIWNKLLQLGREKFKSLDYCKSIVIM